MITAAHRRGRRTAALLGGILSAVTFMPAAAEADAGLASAPVKGFNNSARLLAGQAAGGLYAGLEITMPDGWKTYWRSPGEAGGVPPEFDFQKSDNLASAKVLYPAPQRLTDKSGSVVGYKGHVLYPIAVTAKDTSKPVTLRVAASYGVCKELCIPAEAALELEIPPQPAASDAIADALAKVPRAVSSGAAQPTLAKWAVIERNGKPVLALTVKTTTADGADAFVEAPDGLYLALPKRVGSADGAVLFEVDLTDGVSLKDLAGKTLTVTLVDPTGQAEATIKLE